MNPGTRLDTVLNALGDRQRRRLLFALREENPLTVSESTVDGHSGRTYLDGLERDGLVSMYHAHLPKLDAAGYIEWNRETGEVVRGQEWEEIATVLDLFDDIDDELGVERR